MSTATAPFTTNPHAGLVLLGRPFASVPPRLPYQRGGMAARVPAPELAPSPGKRVPVTVPAAQWGAVELTEAELEDQFRKQVASRLAIAKPNKVRLLSYRNCVEHVCARVPGLPNRGGEGLLGHSLTLPRRFRRELSDMACFSAW